MQHSIFNTEHAKFSTKRHMLFHHPTFSCKHPYFPNNKAVLVLSQFSLPCLTRPQNLGINDWVVTPSFPNLLNKVNDPSLTYFHYFFLMFHYCSCLMSVRMYLQNYSSLSFGCYPKSWWLQCPFLHKVILATPAINFFPAKTTIQPIEVAPRAQWANASCLGWHCFNFFLPPSPESMDRNSSTHYNRFPIAEYWCIAGSCVWWRCLWWNRF